jgi:ABC-type uncharacterized transport system substrate-binding protein
VLRTELEIGKDSALIARHSALWWGIAMKNILSTFLIIAVVVVGGTTNAQQTGKIFRIGFLDSSTASEMAVLVDAFRQELSKLGWTEEKNFTIEYRFAEGKPERTPELAAELVRLKVDLIVTTAAPQALAAKGATTTIPIVMVNVEIPWLSVWSPVWRGREAMSPGTRV